jgi:hypothetical protein
MDNTPLAEPRPLTEAQLWPPITLGKSEIAIGISAWSVGCAVGMLLTFALCVVHVRVF